MVPFHPWGKLVPFFKQPEFDLSLVTLVIGPNPSNTYHDIDQCLPRELDAASVACRKDTERKVCPSVLLE